MAVTILERPQGQVLNITGIDARIDDAYGSPDATVYSVGHGLSDGDYVYSVSDIEDYNGFFYVDSTGSDTFKIKQYSGGDYIQFIQDANVTYYVSIQSHGWSAVHLPITYRLSSDLYPTNTVDTSRNITSVTDSNGYSVIHLSGSLGSAVNRYDFVRITAPNDTELSRVYQILEFISPTVMIINLEYDSSNNFTSATALKEYNNYNIIVRVYAGINSGHEWAAQKPYELAATLEFIPDENGEVFFSINEILKSYVETRNNLTLGTLPNNIDFWTNFYIETAESYDDSDGYAFGTYTSAYTSDQSNFEGTAVNADLEFKNLYSGYMSEYLMTNMTAKFLTLFTIPVLFSCSDDTPDCYNDISILIRHELTSLKLQEQYYSNGVPQTTVTTETDNAYDPGLYRVPLSEAECQYDRVDITLLGSYQEEGDYNEFNEIDNSGETWSTEENVNIGFSLKSFIDTSTKFTNIVYVPFIAPAGTYNISGSQYVNSLGGTPDAVVRFYLIGDDLTILDTSADHALSNDVVETNSEDLTASDPVRYIGMMFEMTVSAAAYVNGTLIATATDSVISETKQFKIDCGCAHQEIRLTWLNNLGGFDYWNFTAKKDHIIEIRETIETKKNILPQWPKSYGANADTIRRQTARVSNKAYTVRSQYITQSEADALAYIKSSVLVQIINSRTDRRTVIVDADSFVIYPDGADLYSIAFNVSFTDDIPSQTV